MKQIIYGLSTISTEDQGSCELTWKEAFNRLSEKNKVQNQI